MKLIKIKRKTNVVNVIDTIEQSKLIKKLMLKLIN